MRSPRSWTLLASLALLCAAPALATPPGESPQDVAEEIDALVAKAWKEAGVRPAKTAGDGEFYRRLHLDLAGRIPEPDDAVRFLATKDPDRALTARGLLYSQDYARAMAVRWANLMIGREAVQARYGMGDAPLVKWLTTQIAANRPWDQIVREILSAEGDIDENGAAQYLSSYRNRPPEIAGNAMKVFQGVQIQCAQCHDHPFTERWSQVDFWGVAAFFARAQTRTQDRKTTVRERPNGEVRLPLPDGSNGMVVDPKFLTGAMAEPGRSTSRRQKLAEFVTAPDNPFFALATVNRVWSFFFVDGIADPDEILLSENKMPAVLEALAGDFRASGYDLRRLCEVIVSTEAYQLTSRGKRSTKEQEALAQVAVFARGALRPLSPEQLWGSFSRAVGLDQINNYRGQFFRVFAGEDQESLAENTIPQALLLMNGAMTNDILRPESNPLVGRLLELSASERISQLFLRVVSRPPTKAELRALKPGRSPSSEEELLFLQDLVWSLLNSSEFVYNH